MKLADISIKRPVFATMMIFALVVLGLFSFQKLSIDLYPDVDFPYVLVTTVLPGAGPEQIETDVTKKIEDAVNPIAGVDFVQSISQENVSIVIIAFKLEVDGKLAAQDVREKVASVRANLPADIEDPVIQRFDPASLPIMTFSVSGTRSEKDITLYAKNVIKKRLESIPGVGSVDLVGGAEREILVELDAAKLRAYNISAQEVAQSIGGANVEIPGGNLIKGSRQLLVRSTGKLRSIEAFNSIIVASPKGRVVHLSDVGRVVDGEKERKSLTRLNGNTSVGLNIIKQSGSNTVQVAEEVKKQIEKLNKDLPEDITVFLAQDNSVFIKDAVNDVLFDIVYGGILAVIVIFLFLANMRATIISALALPASIIASFIIMYALNFTLNMMSLLALSLAVGLLIDDAIVVIENIYRHMAHGETPAEASSSATEEIGLAVMATTFTVVAVFVPVAFMPGIVGRFFYQFGITVAAAVLVSLFVAFSLTPMLSARWLKREDEELSPSGNWFNRFLYYFNHSFEYFSKKYTGALRWSLSHRKTVVVMSVVIFIASIFLGGFLGAQFFPDSDRNEFNIAIRAASGSSLQKTSEICAKVETILREHKEVKAVLTTIGAGNDPVTKASILVKLVGKKERAKSDKAIMTEVRDEVSAIPGAIIGFVIQGMGGGEKPISLSVRGEDFNKIKLLAAKVERIVRNTPGTVDVENSLEESKPEIRVAIKREKANDVGIYPLLLAASVRTMIDGAIATQYQEGEEQIDVRVRLREEDRSNIASLAAMPLKSTKKSAQGADIILPVSEVADIIQGVGPAQINRYNRQREIRVEAGLSNRFLGEALQDIQKELAKLELEPGYVVKVVGEGEQQEESFGNLLLSLMLAIVFVYIVLAAQFESFIHPFSIMLALPMSVIGAILFLLAFGQSMSVMSMIGIIMLMGIVTKNGILLVDYANVLRERGMSRTEALLQAGPTRLRPILMTSFAMIFGMLPVALSLGEGGEFRAPMGQAVIGGLVTSTFLTLFIVPVVYSMLDDLGKFRLPRWFRKNKAGE